MFYPTLKQPSITKSVISNFGGLDRSSVIAENSFSFTANTSSRAYPLLSVREKRLTLHTSDVMPSSLHTKLGICYTEGDRLFFNGVEQPVTLCESDTKQIVSMGSLLCIFPDGLYINTSSLDNDGIATDFGSLSAKFTLTQDSVTVFPCIAGLGTPTVSTSTPRSPKDGQLWLQTSSSPHTLKIYSALTKSWNVLAPTHVRIECPSVSQFFDTGDGVTVVGISDGVDGGNVIAECGEGFIVVSGNIDNYTVISPTEQLPFTISRDLPIMDFVCEHENRLWGCRYGEDSNGNNVNEIYSSKLGDPKNWNVFAGLSTDSYSASCGSEGCFTGITSHLGYVVFFKENHIHRLFGSKPSNFKLYDTVCPGIKKGSEHSLANHNGVLYYHSPIGVCSYAGNSPSLISQKLGEGIYTGGVGAFSDGFYYVCLTDEYNCRSLYVYDAKRSVWHREDESDYVILIQSGQDVLGVKRQNGAYVIQSLTPSKLSPLCFGVFNSEKNYEEEFEWIAESGEIGLYLSDNKFINKIFLRLKTDRSCAVSLMVEYDSNGIYEQAGFVSSDTTRSFSIPFIPRRCDHFRLKLVGRGDCRLYSIVKHIEKASGVSI